jgi:4'-phosphopantetheinyl transferase
VPVSILSQAERDVPGGTGWLAPGEVIAAGPRATAKRVAEARLRRHTAKRAVAAVLGRPADDATLARIRIDHEPGGAPLAVVDGRSAVVSLSVTDRGGHAACAVGPAGLGLGCDLELVEPRRDAFVARCLTAAEQALVRVPGADADVLVNLLWSAKESAVKALRTDPDRDPRTVEVTFPGDEAETGWRPVVVVAREARLLGWWRRDGERVLTVVADRPIAPPVEMGPGAA